MKNKKRNIRSLALSILFSFAFIQGNKQKIAVIDVYIQTYTVNGQPVPSYTDGHGNQRLSGKDYRLQVLTKGTVGGPVHYRYFLEHVSLVSPEDSLSKYNTTAPPDFKESYAEMIDSASVAPEVIADLPKTFTGMKGGH